MEWGGNTLAQPPASSRVSLQRYAPGIAVVFIQTRNKRPGVAESPGKVTQPGSGRVGFELRTS